jgi:formate hydrogenlyase subunit 3/multisubunit Na+/H+ antiporter MnhD subunit
MMTPEQIVFAAIVLCVAGSLLTLVAFRRKAVAGWLNFLLTLSSALLVFSAGFKTLMAGSPHQSVEVWAIRGTLPLRFHVDGFATIFLMLAAFIAVFAALYSIAYMRHYKDYGVGRYYPNFLLFVGGMYGLLCTTDMMWIFCFFWQLMTLPSFLLILYEYKNPENLRAARKYLLMMELACALVMLGGWILGAPGQISGIVKYDFESVSNNLPILLMLRPHFVTLAFGVFLIGFGIKAGMWPFGQMWLPDAHPAAPSPVSALLSGVMIKTGIFGLLRYFLFLVPASVTSAFPLGNWGMLIAILGTITLFTGTMQALKQEQSKRLLAFHSIGQIGYILLGAGACMALLPAGPSAPTALAAIALTGALFHVINHGLFKGLLFLNAGSMLYTTGTQDLNQMGGLMKYMPLTGLTALIASFSISGVPLFNGFASKWSIYVATIQGGTVVRFLPLCAVVAILTSALTLASFIKFFGVSFLSRSSELIKVKAAEGRLRVPATMQIPQVVFALGCIVLGVVPGLAFNYLASAFQTSAQGSLNALRTNPASVPLLGLEAPRSSALFVPAILALLIGVSFLLVYGISKLGSAPRRAATPWLCGYAQEADCNRYVAHNFYGEIKRYFRWLGGTANGAKPAMRKLT